MILHIVDDDDVLADVDKLPPTTGTYVMLRKGRTEDGLPIHDGTDGATAFLYPCRRPPVIETMGEVPGAVPVGAGAVPGTTIFSFLGEDDKR